MWLVIGKGHARDEIEEVIGADGGENVRVGRDVVQERNTDKRLK
jgi:hypothetical protein